jgi:hypothetical protein
MTQLGIQLSQQAQDLMLVEETIQSHQESIAATMNEFAALRKSLGWIADIPGTGLLYTVRYRLQSLSTQLQTLLILRDDISSCTTYR